MEALYKNVRNILIAVGLILYGVFIAWTKKQVEEEIQNEYPDGDQVHIEDDLADSG